MSTANFKAHLNKFAPLSDSEFEQVLHYFTKRSVHKNEVLISPGQSVTETFWVQKGLLLSTYTDPSGKEHVIQFAIENCWITDQPGFYIQTKATFQLQALEDSELLSLTFDNREALCNTFPAIERFFRKKANDSFVKQQQRLLTYLTSDAEKRFDLLLAEYPGLAQRVSKKILAAYLGVSRETLSRFKAVTK